MNKWQVIEDLINKLILKFSTSSFKLLKKCTPSNIKKYSENKINKISNTKESLQIIQKKLIKKVNEKKIKAISNINLTKDNTQKIITKAKTIDYKKLDYKAIFLTLIAIFTPLYLKTKKWFLVLKPSTMVGAICFSTIVGVTGIGVYQNTKSIVEKTRSPANVAPPKATNIRPDYYKDDEKVFLIRNVDVPVYFESIGKSKRHGMKIIKMDLVFQSSNKYIKAFFWKNTHLIYNRINSKLEPISIDFPLKNEGKQIIKAKVLEISNQLLKDLKIKGSFKKIYLNSQIGA